MFNIFKSDSNFKLFSVKFSFRISKFRNFKIYLTVFLFDTLLNYSNFNKKQVLQS